MKLSNYHVVLCTTAVACTYMMCISKSPAAYPDPPGGWTYKYNGDQLTVGAENSGHSSLDGTWTHDNGSDAWDGSEIGGTFSTGGFGIGNGPGGTSLGTQAGVSYLRLQDTGDPRDYSYPDQSNRKVYFGHNIGSDIDPVRALAIMDTGVTLTFRARIPTLSKAGPPLDTLHRDGQQTAGVQPYPDGGDGYVTSDGGKGNFVIRQGGNAEGAPAAAIAFSLTQTNDTTGGNPTTGQAGFAGLTFNEFNGNVTSANVNFGQGTKTNVVAFDPTEWHELYIVIRKDPANIGTHEAFIFRDGGLVPAVFKMTGGTGADMADSFLAMGGSATPQNWALDVDWFGYKDEAVFPPGALLPPSIFGFVPADRTIFHPVASGLQFSASALMPTNTLPSSGFKVWVNGQDVSAQLTLTGTDTSQSRAVSYTGLQPNRLYQATYVVTDSGGLSTTNDIAFDTFVEAQLKTLEAEEYNYNGGQFVDNPLAGGYSGLPGFAAVDFMDTTPSDSSAYRPDAVDLAVSADIARNKYITSGAVDYQVQNIADGEWWNYGARFTTSPNTLWLRYASTAARNIRVDRVVSDPAQTNQTLELVGVISAPNSAALARFNYAQLTDVAGNPVVLPYSGTNIYRLTASGANNDLVINYFFLASAAAATSSAVTVWPLPNATGVRADTAIEATIYDGSTPVNLGSVKLLLSGSEVPAAKSKSGSVTTVKYAAGLLASGTTYPVTLLYNDGADRTNSWTFSTASYVTLTPAMRVTNASIPGFVWKMHQNEANQETSVQKALNALSGALGLPNLANPDATGPASGPGTPANPGNGTMTFTIPGVVNVAQSSGSSFGTFGFDEQMPGIPGLNASTDGIAVQIDALLQLGSGFHTMVVNSDDGFRTTAGFVNDNPAPLAVVDGGRGAADTVFSFAVQEPGVYAFRTIYFEGGSDASIELFMIQPNGMRVLLNDLANGGVPAFQQGTVPQGPVMLSIRRGTGVELILEWDRGTLVSADSVTTTYSPVLGATSPYSVYTTNATQKFYRVQTQ